MTNVFYTQFLLTKKCNQSCSYCDLAPEFRNVRDPGLLEADLDRFKWCIDQLGTHTDNLMIEICGGEPGLVTNLMDALAILIDHPKVIKTQLMSNGLVRILQPECLDMVDSYNEHLIKNIERGEVQKFYNLSYLKRDNAKTVIVLNEDTTNSLINFKEQLKELFDPRFFWLKAFVERSTKNDHLQKMLQVLNSDYYRDVYLNNHDLHRKICSIYSWLPCIDVQDSKIVHCAYHNFVNRLEFDLTETNITKLVQKTLFKESSPSYCQNCFNFSMNSSILMSKSPINRTAENF